MNRSVILTKLCNAFVPSAEGNRSILPVAATGAVERYKRKHGGLWVGGKVFVTEDQIEFVPNGMNVALHANVGRLLIPFEWVRSIEWQFGLLTGIVVVKCEDFDFRFRCFGAKRLVRQLAAFARPNKPLQPIAREDARSG